MQFVIMLSEPQRIQEMVVNSLTPNIIREMEV